MKKLYTLLISVLICTTASAQNTADDPLKLTLNPTTVQYMCKPGALPETDVLVFNITDTKLNPIHEPSTPGITLTLETTAPLSNTKVNEDPGVPVGKYTWGSASPNNTYIPYVMRTWSEVKHTLSDGIEMYLNRYTTTGGEFEITKEGDKYYITASVTGKASDYMSGKEYFVEVTVPKTAVSPEYSFFGLPEVEAGHRLENPGLLGSYQVKRYKGITWGEYSLQFYTVPLDETVTVCGEGAIMTLLLNTEDVGTLDPKSLEGEYPCATYLKSYHDPFSFTSGFCMEQDLVYGKNQSSRIDYFDNKGYIINSSYAKDGNVSIKYLGDLKYSVNAEIVNQFGDKYYSYWEGMLFDCVKYHPDLAGVSDITVDESSAPVEIYDLSGKRIDGEPQPGLYIRRQGDKTSKIIVR